MSSFKFSPEDIRSSPKRKKKNQFSSGAGVLQNNFTYLSYKMALPSAKERNSHQNSAKPNERLKPRYTKPGKPQEEKSKKIKIAENSSSEEKIDDCLPSQDDDEDFIATQNNNNKNNNNN
ncbi:hypothetical protein CEXT_456121 [Caerostris extrusa]|uniref:Uncharacterized protein n=1 Tax=Caerostris extrusa TaxID=172846 RepID=A0AAV4RSP8_CAEEX|nr:hypothetical protein CEXT_456121 [Caerostris extrusa]